ncbi:GGDEF domain-containing protein [Beggiatoa leptomitoformis]|uniref:Diguanylate cyclase DosC n=1 Tax=Beggiatoa leptomitoformis TaxID=288004 RepID=A0A2N9YJN1_9GAMM|nr:GGDEF domain-containing protein [Beggiatoa leptomitoformis]ALG69339.2 diguanylate cyclase [Beggiatoa leptomitoformis]AUI70476.2 diguanylate cyclase [Beggiatoa leptomitoformis]
MPVVMPHDDKKTVLREIEQERLVEIYQHSQALIRRVEAIITPSVERIADLFYTEMLTIVGAQPFLNHALVDTRLRLSLAEWIKQLFLPQTKEEVYLHIQRQREVGNIHARINIPIYLVHHGIRVLKRECRQLLIDSNLERNEMATALSLVEELLDYSSFLINESYFNDIIINERSAQALRMNTINQGLAMDCERLRSLLFDWLRRILTSLYQTPAPTLQQLPTIFSSDFGLWVTYKAELLFIDHQQEVDHLKAQLIKINELVKQAITLRDTNSIIELGATINNLNDAVTHSSWFLSSFINHALEMESGRDPLTHLFNRRYIPTIMQRAIRISATQNAPFCILLLDIDFFKKVNDGWGHDNGDAILIQVGELLVTHVRAGDFVFRYGGEEFLVLLNDINLDTATHIAEKLRLLIEKHTFYINKTIPFTITTSIGIALHEGHPDYSVVISQADGALYQAKEKGRNRIEVANNLLSNPPTTA